MKKTPPRKLTPRGLSTEALVEAGGGGYIRFGPSRCTECGNEVAPDGYCWTCGGYQAEEFNPY